MAPQPVVPSARRQIPHPQAPAASGPVIDAARKAFLEAAVAVVVGTRDADYAPELCRAWGPHVLRGGQHVELCLDRAPAAQTLANLRENGQLAVAFVATDYSAMQVKGRCLQHGGAPSRADAARLARHHQRYGEALALFGLDAQIARRHWSTDVVKVSFAVEALFDQTPGPAAGRPL